MHLRNVPQSGSVEPFTGDPSFELVTVQMLFLPPPPAPCVPFLLVLFPPVVLLLFPRSPRLGPKSSSAAMSANDPTIAKTTDNIFSTILQQC